MFESGVSWGHGPARLAARLARAGPPARRAGMGGTAVNWLLDICPPEFRGYPVLRRHEVVLARFAVLHVEACQAAVRRG